MASLKITLNDKIFLHEDEDKRVTFTQINNFFERFHGRKLQDKEILFYFGHYIKGKTK